MATGHEHLSGRIISSARRRVRAAPPVVLFAQVAHVVGDTAVAAALATTLFFDVPVGEARTEVALYLVLAFAPYSVLAPLIAPLLVRRGRIHGAALVATDILRAVLAALLISALDGPLLYVLGFLLLVLSRVHGISRNALMPELVGKGDELLRANAAVSLVSGVSGALGGGFALVLGSTAGPTAALLLATGAFAAGSLSGLWLAPPQPRTGEIGNHRPRWLGEGATRRSAVSLVSARASLGFTGTVVAFTFHGSDDRVEIAIALGALGVGTALAPLVVPRAREMWQGDLVSAAVVALAVAAVATALLQGLAAAAVLAGAVGFFAAAARIAFDTLVQARVPERDRGSAYARFETMLQLGWVLGAAVGSLIHLSLAIAGSVVAALAAAGIVASRLLDDQSTQPAA